MLLSFCLGIHVLGASWPGVRYNAFIVPKLLSILELLAPELKLSIANETNKAWTVSLPLFGDICFTKSSMRKCSLLRVLFHDRMFLLAVIAKRMYLVHGGPCATMIPYYEALDAILYCRCSVVGLDHDHRRGPPKCLVQWCWFVQVTLAFWHYSPGLRGPHFVFRAKHSLDVQGGIQFFACIFSRHLLIQS